MQHQKNGNGFPGRAGEFKFAVSSRIGPPGIKRMFQSVKGTISFFPRGGRAVQSRSQFRSRQRERTGESGDWAGNVAGRGRTSEEQIARGGTNNHDWTTLRCAAGTRPVSGGRNICGRCGGRLVFHGRIFLRKQGFTRAESRRFPLIVIPAGLISRSLLPLGWTKTASKPPWFQLGKPGVRAVSAASADLPGIRWWLATPARNRDSNRRQGTDSGRIITKVLPPGPVASSTKAAPICRASNWLRLIAGKRTP